MKFPILTLQHELDKQLDVLESHLKINPNKYGFEAWHGTKFELEQRVKYLSRAITYLKAIE